LNESESEAAEALLSLISLRHENAQLVEHCDITDMVVDSDFQPASVTTAPETPLSPLFIPGSDLPSFQITESQAHEIHVPRNRKPRISKVDTILVAPEGLRDARISVMDFLVAILTGITPEFYSYRLAFLSDNTRIRDLLDIVWTEKKSKPAFESWFNDNGIQHICKLVSKEMESVKPMLKMNIKDVTPQFIEQWDINEIIDPVAAATPTWSKILHHHRIMMQQPSLKRRTLQVIRIREIVQQYFILI
jgi:hypothetical protein